MKKSKTRSSVPAIHIASLCMKAEKADVTFVVEDERIPAHRLILAARSNYFQALLYGGLDETKQDEITLMVPLQSFKDLLRYIYSGSLSLKEMKEKDILDTLGLAIQYGFTSVENAIINYLSLNLTINNVCAMLDACRLFGIDDLLSVCDEFVDQQARDVMKHETFQNLTFESLCRLLDRDSFDAPEVDVFNAVHKWYQARQDNLDQYKVIYDKVRFPLLSHSDLVTVVRPTGVLTPEQLLDVVAQKETVHKLRNRVPGENVVNEEITWLQLYEGTIQCAEVVLNKAHIINKIELCYKMDFTDRVDYFVDVSLDKKVWERVGECHHKKATETVHFRARAVQCIRVTTAEAHEEIESIRATLLVKQKKNAIYCAQVARETENEVDATQNGVTQSECKKQIR
uniref:BTB domain-containing protein n=1 Tax=Anopheles christyi TaxID=43041 RepID=A0A182JVX0_9DIPT